MAQGTDRDEHDTSTFKHLLLMSQAESNEQKLKIRKAFQERDLSTIRTSNSWTVFKVMAEFVEGFEKLARIGPCVSIFGSARSKEDSIVYQQSIEVAEGLVKMGFGVITGGGPGVMEAGNKGAYEAGGRSAGLCISLPFEARGNVYIDQDKLITFDYFFVRKVMFMKYSQGFVVMPGGFGTMDELFEALTLVQTQKIDKFPVVLVGKAYWGGLLDWLEGTMLSGGYISPGDTDLFKLVDTPQEAVSFIDSFYQGMGLTPNF